MSHLDGVDLAQISTFAGGATACGGTALFTVNENSMILLVSLLGAVIGLIGLIYTIISGERSHRMRLREMREHNASFARRITDGD